MTVIQSFRTDLGWSPERLAKESGVEVASIYLLERLGSAGPEDDATIFATIEKNKLRENDYH